MVAKLSSPCWKKQFKLCSSCLTRIIVHLFLSSPSRILLVVLMSICCLIVCLPALLPDNLFICLSICISVYLSACLFLWLSVCPCVCLSVYYFIWICTCCTSAHTSSLVLPNIPNGIKNLFCRYLYLLPYTHERTCEVIEMMLRLRRAKNLDLRLQVSFL